MSRLSTRAWNDSHTFTLLSASVCAFGFGYMDLIIYTSTLSFLFLVGTRLQQSRTWANGITMARMLLISVVLLFSSSFTSIQLFTALGVAVLLDVLDGYVARKTNAANELGFILDLEVDAYFVLMMSFYFYQVEGMPLWVLLPGLMRYLYKLVTILNPKPSFVESKKSYAAIIAGAYFVILLLGIIVNDEARIPMLFIGGMAIVFSFGVSLLEYIRWEKK